MEKPYVLVPGTPAAAGARMKTFYASEEKGSSSICTMTHWHEEAECITVLCGSLDFQVNESVITLHEKDTLLVLPGTIHRNITEPEGTSIIRILVNQTLLTSDPDIRTRFIHPLLENRLSDYLYVPAGSEGADRLQFLIRDIEKTEREASPYSRLKVIALLHFLLYDFCLLFPPERKSASLPSPSDRAVQKDMVEYIKRNYADKITLDDIASAGKVSRSKCCSLFKIYMGSSPIDYVNEYRLGVSRTLLEYQDTSIADIAFACGFTSQSYFSKLFSRSFHMTPKEFRASRRTG